MGLSYRNKSFLIARDRKARMMYLGGLGAFGVGEMWFIAEEHSERFENWDSAPERTCPTSECRCLSTHPEGKLVGTVLPSSRCWGRLNHELPHYMGAEGVDYRVTWT